MWNIRFSCRLGGLANPAAHAILNARAILDISGGDSFTDLYGPRRFESVTRPKHLALENCVPLVLLPQTYGPFSSTRNRRIAESIVRRATMAWARDERSFERLRELAGNDFDPARHCCGVDVAFALEAIRPPQPLPSPLASWLERRDAPLIGINVSGLIYNNPESAAKQYGLRADYREVIAGLIRRLLADSDCRIVLVPHVITPPGHYESDIAACQRVAEQFQEHAARICVLPAMDDPRHVKWVIAQTDWFCGTRMHACIAALSSGVPAAAIAYSLKTIGVFETCRQGEHVVDARNVNTGEMVQRLTKSWRARGDSRAVLIQVVTDVAFQSERQMRRMIACIEGEQKVAGTPARA